MGCSKGSPYRSPAHRVAADETIVSWASSSAVDVPIDCRAESVKRSKSEIFQTVIPYVVNLWKKFLRWYARPEGTHQTVQMSMTSTRGLTRVDGPRSSVNSLNSALEGYGQSGLRKHNPEAVANDNKLNVPVRFLKGRRTKPFAGDRLRFILSRGWNAITVLSGGQVCER